MSFLDAIPGINQGAFFEIFIGIFLFEVVAIIISIIIIFREGIIKDQKEKRAELRDLNKKVARAFQTLNGHDLESKFRSLKCWGKES